MKFFEFEEIIKRQQLFEDIEKATEDMYVELSKDKRDDEIIVFVPTKVRVRDNKHISMQENINIAPFLDKVRREK